MNERIRQLAEQAGAEFYTGFCGSPNSVKFMEDEFQKFAEALIGECAKFLDENSGADECGNVWYPEPEELLKHFGAE